MILKSSMKLVALCDEEFTRLKPFVDIWGTPWSRKYATGVETETRVKQAWLCDIFGEPFASKIGFSIRVKNGSS